jgi:predicted nucleotidyltransferase
MNSTVADRFDEASEPIRRLLESHHVRLAYLFGSAARAVERADSDLDIAVLLERGVPRAEYGRIRLELATTLVGLTQA